MQPGQPASKVSGTDISPLTDTIVTGKLQQPVKITLVGRQGMFRTVFLELQVIKKRIKVFLQDRQGAPLSFTGLIFRRRAHGESAIAGIKRLTTRLRISLR